MKSNSQGSPEASSCTLNIVSWNIHGLKDANLGPKTNCHEFLSQLSGSHIFLLQETKGSVEVDSYICHNKTRPNPRSGGLTIGVHSTIAAHTKIIKTNHEDLLALRISRKITGTGKDLTIINVYDSPPESSYKKKWAGTSEEKDTLHDLNQLLLSLRQTEILIAGDMNARLGGLNTIPPNQHISEDILSSGDPSYRQLRSSKDTVCNERGTKLLDCLSSTELTILNGCTIGDLTGQLTCHTYNGASVVDYIIASDNIRSSTRSLKVRPLLPLSDHCPIEVVLNTKTILESATAQKKLLNLPEAPRRIKWKDTTTLLIKERQVEDSGTIIELTQTCCNNRDDVYSMNQKISDLLVAQLKSTETADTKKKHRKKRYTKSKWYDKECDLLRCETNRLARAQGKGKTVNPRIKDLYHQQKRLYRRTMRNKRSRLKQELSSRILTSKTLNWDTVDELKQQFDQKYELSISHMTEFHSFFNQLYSKNQNEKTETWKADIQTKTSLQSDLESALNQPICTNDVERALKDLKRGKSPGIDGIPNELLKEACPNTIQLLTHLYNQCLEHGVYPWNTTVITPIHKKGPKHDPNNYRAIAVGSSLGRVFSTIYLERLVNFRKTHCPDPPNQQGFVKSAQTSDHLLTLHTAIQKGIQNKGRLYTCFIDFRKAFDGLNRDALLLKLLNLGVRGKFFNVLDHMYNNSKARLKLAKKLSDLIDIGIGTEQGHVTSPELFKCFLLDLSNILNDQDLQSDPVALGTALVNHLLWADDLVLMSTSAKGLQKLLDALYQFCSEWDLTVNTEKTATMVFNQAGRKLKESNSFLYGDSHIPSTKTYQYLGLTFTLNGNLQKAQKQLRIKGMRSIFAIKRIVDIRSISKLAALKLFDALVAPVTGYASAIWLHQTKFLKTALNEKHVMTTPKDIWDDQTEKCHTSFLRWLLGLRKNTPLPPLYGDTGRVPLVVRNIKHLLDFHNRLCIMSNTPEYQDKLVVHAYNEQKRLKLPWYQSVLRTSEIFDSNAHHPQKTLLPNSQLVQIRISDWFWTQWDVIRHANRKLEFYNSVKASHGFEDYLERRTAPDFIKLRTSTHRLKIETGRHNKIQRSERFCDDCCSAESIPLLHALPFFDPIIRHPR